MFGKPEPMSEVKQILRLSQHGKGIKTIAKTLSISKNPVKEYIRKAEANNILIEGLLTLEDPVLDGNYVLKADHLKTRVTMISNPNWIKISSVPWGDV